MAFVYISLFYLGATSGGVAEVGSNGTVILSQYVQMLFGPSGQVVLSCIVLLACLTTAIGLISACADYFSSLTCWSYTTWVFIVGIVSATVANVGLEQLIAISVPVLYALYPVAIVLVVLTFFRQRLPNPQLAYQTVITVAFLFAVIDALRALGFNMDNLSVLPLFQYGKGWLVPSALALIFSLFMPEKAQQQAAESNR